MAMTKREQKEMGDLKMELALAKALRFTDQILPDIPCEGLGSKVVEGFAFNDYWQNPKVEPSCSSENYHGLSNGKFTNIQRGINQYSTRLLALRALRNAMEIQCAKILAGIDFQIQKELNGNHQSGT